MIAVGTASTVTAYALYAMSPETVACCLVANFRRRLVPSCRSSRQKPDLRNETILLT
jgi:hypothetical protein